MFKKRRLRIAQKYEVTHTSRIIITDLAAKRMAVLDNFGEISEGVGYIELSDWLN